MADFVTCLSKIKKGIEDEKAPDHLLVGLESKAIAIMQPSGVKELTDKRIKLPSVPVFIETQGTMDVEHKIYAACRDGKIYIYKNGALKSSSFDVESMPVGMVLLDKMVLVGGMN